MCLGEKKIAIVLQIKKSDNWFRFAHLQPTKTRRTTTITALDLPNLNDLKIFYSLQDLSPTTGGPVLNEGDNEGDFDDLLPGNIVVGLRPGPTKPRTQTRAQPLSLMPRMPWMIQSFLLADFLQRKRMRTTLMICCWETLLLAWNWVQPTSHKHELNRYNWCQGCLGPSSWLLFFREWKWKRVQPTQPRARAKPLSLTPRMSWMIRTFLLSHFFWRKKMKTTLISNLQSRKSWDLDPLPNNILALFALAHEVRPIIYLCGG